jgi:hypothetical protein
MSAIFDEDIELLVTTCAVDFGPVLWAVFCEVCGKQLNEGSQDEALVGKIEVEHQAFHLDLTVKEFRALRKHAKQNRNADNIY